MRKFLREKRTNQPAKCDWSQKRLSDMVWSTFSNTCIPGRNVSQEKNPILACDSPRSSTRLKLCNTSFLENFLSREWYWSQRPESKWKWTDRQQNTQWTEQMDNLPSLSHTSEDAVDQIQITSTPTTKRCKPRIFLEEMCFDKRQGVLSVSPENLSVAWRKYLPFRGSYLGKQLLVGSLHAVTNAGQSSSKPSVKVDCPWNRTHVGAFCSAVIITWYARCVDLVKRAEQRGAEMQHHPSWRKLSCFESLIEITLSFLLDYGGPLSFRKYKFSPKTFSPILQCRQYGTVDGSQTGKSQIWCLKGAKFWHLERATCFWLFFRAGRNSHPAK